MIRNTALTIVTYLCLAGAAAAQEPVRSFDELKTRIAIGETVYVVDASGHDTKGRLARLSDTSLTVVVDGTPREFVVDDVIRIERRHRDSVKNGVLIGAGTGAVVGFGAGRSADSPACPRPGIECGQGSAIGMVTGALWGAVGGWIADTLIRSREVVYLGLNTPQWEPQ